MATRRLNYRLAKIHLNYYVDEIASLYDVHRNTVRQWIKTGLPTVDHRRPMLIRGSDLRAFIQARREVNTRTCQPGEIYCVRCHEPKKPAGNMADCECITSILGNLVGICPTCESMIYRRVNLGKLEQVRGQLEVTMPQALPHINDSDQPSVNSD
jgi:hypothetical protein